MTSSSPDSEPSAFTPPDNQPPKADPPSKSKRPMLPVVLAVLLVLSLAASAILGILLNQASADVALLAQSLGEADKQIAAYAAQVHGLKTERNDLESKISARDTAIADYEMKYDHALNHIASLTLYNYFYHRAVAFSVPGSNTYHVPECDIVLSADYYFIHNVEYYGNMNYAACPHCWDSWELEPYSTPSRLELMQWWLKNK